MKTNYSSAGGGSAACSLGSTSAQDSAAPVDQSSRHATSTELQVRPEGRRTVEPKTGRFRVWSFLLAVSIVGCGDNSIVVAPDAAPSVDRLANSPAPQRWDFNHQRDSASPYRECLNGFDEVAGEIDVDAGVLRLTPQRDAPTLIVTPETLLVPDASRPSTWLEIPLTSGFDRAQLDQRFGEVLAGYIDTGLAAPDLRTTVLAAIDIATAVDATTAPFGLPGDAIKITIDPDRYLSELEAGGVVITDDDRNRIPTLIATIDSAGRVTALVVDPGGGGDVATGLEHRDRYIVTASYDELEPIALPEASPRSATDLDDLSYPSPSASCRLGS